MVEKIDPENLKKHRGSKHVEMGARKYDKDLQRQASIIHEEDEKECEEQSMFEGHIDKIDEKSENSFKTDEEGEEIPEEREVVPKEDEIDPTLPEEERIWLKQLR
jgi:hypothetical protein